MKNLRTGTAKFDTIRAKDANGLHLQDDAGNGMFIKDGGNVGIGTVNPVYNLHVSDSSSANFLIQKTTPGGQVDGITLNSVSGAGINNRTGDISLIMTSSAGDAEPALRFSTTNGAQGTKHAIFISNGRVGIGTADPSSMLHISGASPVITLTDTNTNADSSISADSGKGSLFINADINNEVTDSAILLNVDGAEKMRVDSNGNVGIGTADPSALLHVVPKNNVDANEDATHASVFKISDNATTGLSQGRNGGATYIDANYYLSNSDIFTVKGRGENKFTIKGGGNVGIGTTSPDFNLSVVSDTDPAKIGIHGYGSFSDGTVAAQLLFLGKDSNDNNRNLAHIQVREHAHSSGTGSMEFFTRIGGNEDARMVIGSNGNVGIGTTNPTANLQIADHQGSPQLIISNNSSSSNSASIKFISGGTGNPISLIESGGTNSGRQGLFFSTGLSTGSVSPRMVINSDGNVGIGTTSPGSHKLNVNGTTFCTDGVWAGSDDRIKHNEQPIVGALETLSKITPKKYIKTTEMYDANHDFELDADGNPIDDNGEPVEHRIEAGVIAQQVLTVDELAFAVSPEGVDEDGVVTSPHGLDYNSLFTYAIAAIQEQQEIIETQNSRIDELISRIETLEQ